MRRGRRRLGELTLEIINISDQGFMCANEVEI